MDHTEEEVIQRRFSNQGSQRRRSRNYNNPNDDFIPDLIPESEEPLSSIPDVGKEEGTHTGAYGRLKYKYTGKHSEGNRFIKNHEL